MGHKVSVPDPERHNRAEQRAKRKRVVSDSEDVGNASSVAAASTTTKTMLVQPPKQPRMMDVRQMMLSCWSTYSYRGIMTG